MNTLEKIAAEHIPTHSAVAAIQHMRDTGWFEKSAEDFRFHIVDIAGTPAPTEDERELNYTLRYLVTTAIEHPEHTGKAMLELAYQKAVRHIANNPFVFAVPDEDAAPKLDAAGNVKPKKGAKKEMARKVYDAQIRNTQLTRKEAIAILVEEVGLTSAGASTYYANLKKGVM